MLILDLFVIFITDILLLLCLDTLIDLKMTQMLTIISLMAGSALGDPPRASLITKFGELGLDFIDLLSLRYAPKNCGHLQLHLLGKQLDIILDLKGQLSSWSKNQYYWFLRGRIFRSFFSSQ